jgi:DNA-binding CsgD family transcriptional regulator
VAFRHPLVRSAAYAAGSPEARQTVHAALADVTDQQADADRHAWHRAQAAARPDDAVAEELELSAGRARARGGYAAAGAFLQRSAALTLDPARRAERSLAAAHAKFQAGAWEAALGLIAAAEAGPLDDLRSAQLDLLHARITFACSHGSDAPQLLLKAARQLEKCDMGLARDVYLEAVSAALFASRLATGADLREVAEAALAVPSPRPPSAPDLLLNGLALLITEGHSAAAPVLKRALQAFRTIDVSEEEGLGWLWQACGAAGHVWDYESWDVLSARMVDVVRNTGALTALPIAYSTRAGVHKFAGEFALAASLVSEVEAISEVIGSNIAPYASLALAAFQGREADALALIEAGTKDVLQRGEGEGLTFIQWATAVLCNGLGRYEDALAAAELASEDTPAIWFTNWALVELIEAATRTDERDLAVSALNRLSETTRASGTDWAVGVEARSRALVSEGTAAENCYKQAIDSLGRTPLRVELARAHLLYGEWLRRQQRRRDARDQLHVAHGTLESIGAAAFAGRARQELRATGEHVRKRTVDTQVALTAQEALIARIAARGASNPQIAAQLFISPATVAYHLRKVFAKLDVGSRHELARKVEAQQPSSQSVLLPSS